MYTELEAVYENGVFRPLRPIQLPEHQRVTLRVANEESGAPPDSEAVQFVLPPDRWQAFCDALDSPPRDIPALRRLLQEASLFDGNRTASQ